LKLFCQNGNIKTDITDLTGRIGLVSDMDQVAEVLSFTVAYNEKESKFYPENPAVIGSLVMLEDTDGTEEFRGLVKTLSRSLHGVVTYQCYDYLDYLKRNKEVFQFDNIIVSDCLELIFNHYNVDFTMTSELGSVVDKWYYSQTPLEIIKDLIEFETQNTGVDYYMKIVEGKIVITELQDEPFEPNLELYVGDPDKDLYVAEDFIADSSHSETIEDLRNTVKVIYQDKPENSNIISVRTAVTLQDAELVEKYGLFQEVLEIEPDDISKAENMAKVMLAKLSAVGVSDGITLLGDLKARAGKSMILEEPIAGISGTYYISHASHEYSGGLHTMKLELKK